MCYRYKATSVAFASLISIAAFSVQAMAESDLYVTGGVSSFDIDDASPTAATFRGGWNWNEHFGAEIEGSVGIDSDAFAAAPFDLDVESQVGAYFVGRVPVSDNASFFGRVGYARTEIESLFSASSFIIQTEGIAFGAGGEYMFTDRFGIRGEYTQLDTDGETRDAIEVLSLSAVIKFDGLN
jgi:hypothetical protein